MNIVYLNGTYLPQEKATISVMDRGFLFGDGVYEVIPAYDGHLFGLEEHLTRLSQSLKAIHMETPLPNEAFEEIFQELLKRNQKTSGTHSIYLQVTRGAESTRNHALPKSYKPTVLAFCGESRSLPKEVLDRGFSAITLDDTRRRDCCIKAITLLPNILLYEEAKRAGAAEAILIRNNEAMEGTSSNLFVVWNSELLTPPLNTYILGGVTRELIITLAKEHQIPFRESSITKNMLWEASEIWMTGSSKEIYPIVTLDNQPIGNGKVGPLWQAMYDHYKHYKQITRSR